jgi:hypothetical protein
MNARMIRLSIFISSTLAAASAHAGDVVLPRDTRVYLATKQELVGKKGELEVGQLVRCEVWRDVLVDGRVVIAAGTPATAKVDSLSYRKVAGIKGKMSLAALETETVQRQPLSLTGGYNKEGTGRIALSASLSALVAWPLIFIPGKAAELPVGTVFDAYTLQSATVALGGEAAAPPAIRIGSATEPAAGLSAELLYDKLQGQEKPRVFEFLIHAPASAPTEFVIDTINGARVDPIALTTLSSSKDGDELTVNAAASINDLAKQFKRGINTIEIAYGRDAARVGSEVVVNIQF